MSQSLSKRTKIQILLISLVIHAIIILSLLGPQTPHYFLNIPQEKKEEIMKSDDNQHATHTVTHIISQGTSPVTTVLFMPNEPETIAPCPTIATPDAPAVTADTSDDQLLSDHEIKTIDSPIEPRQDEQYTDELHDESKQHEYYEEQEQSHALDDTHEIQDLKNKTIIQDNFAYHPPSPQKTTASSHQRKKLTLAEITKGFIQSVAKEHAQQTMSPPDLTTPLSLQIYQTKVFALLQRSLNSLKKVLYAQEASATHVTLTLTIDCKGNLLALSLSPTPRLEMIKNWFITAAKNVGLFPPIPKSLNKKTITLQYPIYIETTKGFGSYSLMYGPTKQS